MVFVGVGLGLLHLLAFAVSFTFLWVLQAPRSDPAVIGATATLVVTAAALMFVLGQAAYRLETRPEWKTVMPIPVILFALTGPVLVLGRLANSESLLPALILGLGVAIIGARRLL